MVYIVYVGSGANDDSDNACVRSLHISSSTYNVDRPLIIANLVIELEDIISHPTFI